MARPTRIHHLLLHGPHQAVEGGAPLDQQPVAPCPSHVGDAPLQVRQLRLLGGFGVHHRLVLPPQAANELHKCVPLPLHHLARLDELGDTAAAPFSAVNETDKSLIVTPQPLILTPQPLDLLLEGIPAAISLVELPLLDGPKPCLPREGDGLEPHAVECALQDELVLVDVVDILDPPVECLGHLLVLPVLHHALELAALLNVLPP
mmetsp:Transcript_37651/g.106379  ORF Transcript_37651/g.106379 Transcript_37651/m.106379 type:complete len:205 (+) Transcript_37651:938-1552(+)